MFVKDLEYVSNFKVNASIHHIFENVLLTEYNYFFGAVIEGVYFINTSDGYRIQYRGCFVYKDLNVVPFKITCPIKFEDSNAEKNLQKFKANFDSYVETISNTTTFAYVTDEFGKETYDRVDIFDMYDKPQNLNLNRKMVGFTSETTYYWTRFFKECRVKIETLRENGGLVAKRDNHLEIMMKDIYSDVQYYSNNFTLENIDHKTNFKHYLDISGFRPIKKYQMDLFTKEFNKGIKVYVNHLYIIIEHQDKVEYYSVLKSKYAKGKFKSVVSYGTYLASLLKFQSVKEKDVFVNNYKNSFRG